MNEISDFKLRKTEFLKTLARRLSDISGMPVNEAVLTGVNPRLRSIHHDGHTRVSGRSLSRFTTSFTWEHFCRRILAYAVIRTGHAKFYFCYGLKRSNRELLLSMGLYDEENYSNNMDGYRQRAAKFGDRFVYLAPQWNRRTKQLEKKRELVARLSISKEEFYSGVPSEKTFDWAKDCLFHLAYLCSSFRDDWFLKWPTLESLQKYAREIYHVEFRGEKE